MKNEPALDISADERRKMSSLESGLDALVAPSQDSLVAACFRAADGTLEALEWGNSVLSSMNPALNQTVKALALLSPSEESFEASEKFLAQFNHPELPTIFAAAAGFTPYRERAELLVRLSQGYSDDEADLVAQAALANPNVDKEAITKIVVEYRSALAEFKLLSPTVAPSGSSTFDWKEPKLLTSAVKLATSSNQPEFDAHVDSLVRDFPSYAAGTLAAVANTHNNELREWCLSAFEEQEKLADFSEIIQLLTVTACAVPCEKL